MGEGHRLILTPCVTQAQSDLSYLGLHHGLPVQSLSFSCAKQVMTVHVSHWVGDCAQGGCGVEIL